MAIVTGIEGMTEVPRADGGTTLLVKGSGFGGATDVVFRDPNGKTYRAQSYTIDSDSQITVVSPAVDNHGTYDIVVMTGTKESTTPLVQAYAAAGDGDVRPGAGSSGLTLTTQYSAVDQIRIERKLSEWDRNREAREADLYTNADGDDVHLSSLDDCKGRQPGNYLHPDDCTKFVACTPQADAIVYECPSCENEPDRCTPVGRMVYNVRADACMWADLTDCFSN
ncbi:chitin binding peritrophin-A domain-containing protein [Nocardia sp. NPDC056000]|uniref:chitin binding peritrophin-A domain-containing protein n=1 Tax=Nocardia sp. NPDC056000 TaxID=3345674 RepID=UPI0035D6454E